MTEPRTLRSPFRGSRHSRGDAVNDLPEPATDSELREMPGTAAPPGLRALVVPDADQPGEVARATDTDTDTDTVTLTDSALGPDPNGRGKPPALTIFLVAVIAAAALVIAGGGGWLLRGSAAAAPRVTDASVDAGFARDMSTHHTQAVTMAGYARDTTTNPQLRVLAFDVETAQQFQIGQMQGWLDTWGLSRSTGRPVMAWIPADAMSGMGGMAGLPGTGSHTMPGGRVMTSGTDMQPADAGGAIMPGMATAAQMDRLETLRGPALDVFFLQLMIRHHQGGIPMARYATAHASTAYVRDLANKMVSLQQAEVMQMTQMLRRLGGDPLPPPGR